MLASMAARSLRTIALSQPSAWAVSRSTVAFASTVSLRAGAAVPESSSAAATPARRRRIGVDLEEHTVSHSSGTPSAGPSRTAISRAWNFAGSVGSRFSMTTKRVRSSSAEPAMRRYSPTTPASMWTFPGSFPMTVESTLLEAGDPVRLLALEVVVVRRGQVGALERLPVEIDGSPGLGDAHAGHPGRTVVGVARLQLDVFQHSLASRLLDPPTSRPRSLAVGSGLTSSGSGGRRRARGRPGSTGTPRWTASS